MWDREIWRGRYTHYSWQSLLELLKEHDPDSDHGKLIDEEIARRLEAKRQASG